MFYFTIAIHSQYFKCADTKVAPQTSVTSPKCQLLCRGLHTSLEYQTPVDLGERFFGDYNPVSPQER